MATLDKVCCILDVDGFDARVYSGRTYSNKFYVRELAYVRIDKVREFLPISHRFDLTGKINFRALSPQERRTLEYQSRRVTGLSVLPVRDEVVEKYENLECVIRGMYDTSRQSGSDVVAFKGGNKERDLLQSLGIPFLDLGLYGCPPYAKLIEKNRVYSTIRDCGHHKLLREGLIHCPMAEVVVFRDWYMLNYKISQTAQDSEYDSSSSCED